MTATRALASRSMCRLKLCGWESLSVAWQRISLAGPAARCECRLLAKATLVPMGGRMLS